MRMTLRLVHQIYSLRTGFLITLGGLIIRKWGGGGTMICQNFKVYIDFGLWIVTSAHIQ